MKQTNYEEKIQKLLNKYQNQKVKLQNSVSVEEISKNLTAIFEIMDNIDELLMKNEDIVLNIKQLDLKERLQKYREPDAFDKELRHSWLEHWKKESIDFWTVGDPFVDPDLFNMRKRMFGKLFINKEIPERLKTLLEEHQKVFLSGAYNASIALCRVILEVALYNKLKDNNILVHPGIEERNLSGLLDLLKDPKIKKYIGLKNELESKAHEIRKVTNKALHWKSGKCKKIRHTEDEALKYIHDTFEILEALYK